MHQRVGATTAMVTTFLRAAGRNGTLKGANITTDDLGTVFMFSGRHPNGKWYRGTWCKARREVTMLQFDPQADDLQAVWPT